MTFEERQAKTDKFFEDCKQILLKKGADYTVDNDAFKDLRAVAEEVEVPPLKLLWIFMRKHLSSVKNYIKKGKVESEPIEERLKDIANYCSLINALIEEEKSI